MNILRSESFQKNAALTLAGAVVGYLASDSLQGAVAGAITAFSTSENGTFPNAIKTTVIATTFFSCGYFATEKFIPKELSLLAGILSAGFHDENGSVTYPLFNSCITRYISTESLAIFTSFNLIEKYTEPFENYSFLSIAAAVGKGTFIALNAWQGRYIESLSLFGHSFASYRIFPMVILGAFLATGYKTLESATSWEIAKSTKQVAISTFQDMQENSNLTALALTAVTVVSIFSVFYRIVKKTSIQRANVNFHAHQPLQRRSTQQQSNSREREIRQRRGREIRHNQYSNSTQSNPSDCEIPSELENDATLQSYKCPIIKSVALHPVLDPTNLSTIYEKANILRHLTNNPNSPVTRKTFTYQDLIPLPAIGEYIGSRAKKPNDSPNEELKKAAEEEYKKWTEMSTHFNAIEQFFSSNNVLENLKKRVLRRLQSVICASNNINSRHSNANRQRSTPPQLSSEELFLQVLNIRENGISQPLRLSSFDDSSDSSSDSDDYPIEPLRTIPFRRTGRYQLSGFSISDSESDSDSDID